MGEPGAGAYVQRAKAGVSGSKFLPFYQLRTPDCFSKNLKSLVSSIHPPEKVLDVAIEIANKIVKQSKLTAAICKEAVNNAYEMTLKEGLRAEKRLFHATFATEDRSEGMKAFVEKRKPNFSDK